MCDLLIAIASSSPMSKIFKQASIASLARRLKGIRIENKMSQKDVALAANMNVTQYRRIENGDIDAGGSQIERIAMVYDLNLVEFYSWVSSADSETLTPTKIAIQV